MPVDCLPRFSRGDRQAASLNQRARSPAISAGARQGNSGRACNYEPVPDDRDYVDLAEMLARPLRWSDAEATHARLLRKSQAEAIAASDQRDRKRIAAMWNLVREIDKAITQWEKSR